MTHSDGSSLWQKNTPVINAWLSIASPVVAEVVSAQGYDSVTIDTQHGLIDYPGMLAMLQAMQGAPVTPIVRVPWLDPAAIMKAMDAGALGIICPMINTRAQAEQLVSCMRYPPAGQRSYGPTRAVFSEGPDYYRRANREVVALAMIETAEAMENLDEIVSTPGLDGVYIGPSDLALGISDGQLPPQQDYEIPQVIDAVQRIRQASRQAGIRACMHTVSAGYAARAAGWGFDMVTLANDIKLLTSGASAQVRETRELLASGA